MKNNQNKKNRQPTAEEQFRKMAVLAAGICENRPWEHAGCPGPFVCYYDDGMETYIYILITDDAGNRGFRIYHTRRDYARSCTPVSYTHLDVYKRQALFNAAKYVCLWCPTFSAYLEKKRSEGKHYNVAISHAAKKLVRLIFAMQRSGKAFLADY